MILASKQVVEDAQRDKWLFQPPFSVQLGETFNSWQAQINYLIQADKLDINENNFADKIRKYFPIFIF